MLATLLIALIPGAFEAHLVRIQSAWSGPVLMALCATALAMIILLAMDAIRRLPPRRVIPSVNNIETCVRMWLDNFRYAVQNAPIPITHFRFIVTVDSGTKMIVVRLREEFTDYLVIRSELDPSNEELKRIEEMTEDERTLIIMEIRLELARRNIGYSGLSLPIEDFGIFKRIPVRDSLTEHEFIAALDEVEAAVHIVGIVFSIALTRRAQMMKKQDQKLLPLLDGQ